jgi:hypothetical protein
MKQRVLHDLIMYQRAHRDKRNQWLHYLAFFAASVGWVALLIDWRVTAGCAILHYACAWTGHFVFERNRPASFQRPLIGFYAGFLWFFLRTLEIVSGKRWLPQMEDI